MNPPAAEPQPRPPLCPCPLCSGAEGGRGPSMSPVRPRRSRPLSVSHPAALSPGIVPSHPPAGAPARGPALGRHQGVRCRSVPASVRRASVGALQSPSAGSACLPPSVLLGRSASWGHVGRGRGLARHPPSPRPSALPPTWFRFPLTTSGWGISEASSSSSVTPPPTHTHSLSHSLTHTSTPLMDKQKPVALVSAHSQPPLSPRTSASGFFFQRRSLGATSGLPVAGCPHCASESSVRLENTFICPGDNLRNAVLGAAQATWMLSRAEAL